jgi:hypothetical protein
VSEDSWKRTELFAGLSNEELATVHPAFEPVSVPAGKDVITEGDSGDDMFLLVDGKVRVSKSMVLKGTALPVLEAESTGKTLAELSDSQHPFSVRWPCSTGISGRPRSPA